MNTSREHAVREIRSQRCGARFHRCALQVNPFAYRPKYRGTEIVEDESSYNRTMIEALQSVGVEVISVTDHFEIRSAQSLMDCAREAGIEVLPGFEAVSSDNVHYLCIFDPNLDTDTLMQHIGELQPRRVEESPSRISKLPSSELLIRIEDLGGICIAAHAISPTGGILGCLTGQARVQAWRNEKLLAAAIPAPLEELTGADPAIVKILRNREKNYIRTHSMALLGSTDISSPEDVSHRGAASYIKMSKPSVEALRQAFCDHESRIRFDLPTRPCPRSEIVGIHWDGGFLRNQAIAFNEEFNAIIGGRGAGKTALLESIGYVLQSPLFNKREFISDVIQSSTTITLLLRHMDEQGQTLEIVGCRMVGDEASRFYHAHTWQETNKEFHPWIEDLRCFPQHSIVAMAQKSAGLADVISMSEARSSHETGRQEILSELRRTQKAVIFHEEQVQQLEDEVADLPQLEISIQKFEEMGLDERLGEHLEVSHVESWIDDARQTIDALRINVIGLREHLRLVPENLKFEPADERDHEAHEHASSLARSVIEELHAATPHLDGLDAVVLACVNVFSDAHERWLKYNNVAEERYRSTLHALQEEGLNGLEYVEIRTRVQELKMQQEQLHRAKDLLHKSREERTTIVARWSQWLKKRYRFLKKYAELITKVSDRSVQVEVTQFGTITPVLRLLEENVGGQLKHTRSEVEQLHAAGLFSTVEFADAIRAGGSAVRTYIPKTTPNQAQRIAQRGESLALQMEELDLDVGFDLRLNVGTDEVAEWRSLSHLSSGQKATAVLLTLLLEGQGTLVIDQPEDDLDNRFISDMIVGLLRKERQRRQLLFATHNANISVLGDADLLLALIPHGSPGSGHTTIETRGGLDDREVCIAAQNILEGGQMAFETRRRKYGY